MLSLQQNHKNVENIPQMFANWKQSSYQVTFLIYEKVLFSFLSK